MKNGSWPFAGILASASLAGPTSSAQLPPLTQSLAGPPGTSPSRPVTGDVNGDGFADVVVGSPGTSAGGFPGVGSALVFLGPGLSTLLPVPNPAPAQNVFFGTSVATGDVDGDRFDDLVVGAPYADPPGFNNGGEAFVLAGPGLVSALPLAQPTPEASAGFGISVDSGDVNGDGLDDVVVGAGGASQGGPAGAGGVFVFLGPVFATVLTLAEPVQESGAFFGTSIATGDVDGDGFDDVVAGAYAASSGGQPAAGEAFVFLGPALASILPLSDPTPETNGTFGRPVSAGDVDGDGFADVLVGVPLADPGGLVDAGEVFVFLGPALTSVLPLADPVPEATAQFGTSIAVGDFDGDGFEDVLVGAQSADVGGLTNAGEAFVFLGPALATVVPLADPTPQASSTFGTSISAGDVNGDGADDVVVGVPSASPAGEAVVFVPQFDLGLNTLSLSASAGGTITFSLDAGNANAGRFFVLAGSGTGTSPCFPIGSVCVPIAADPVTLLLLEPSVVVQFLGTLDATGGATRSFPVGPGVFPASTIGLRLFVAYALALPFDYASRPVVLEVGP